MDAEFAAHLHDVMAQNMWGVYLCLIIAPFLQEDAAVVGAATLSLAGMGENALIFTAVTAGLIGSDLWKYWLGRAARSRVWAQRYAEKPAVRRAEDLVLNRLGASIMAVRFVPGTRIALYIAAGYFRAHWPAFALWVAFSALIYVALAFALFHVIGAVAGEAARVWLPIGALSALVLYLAARWFQSKRGARLEATTD